MPRSMWKGAIQFGLVTIPVKLYTATESDYAIRFNMLHAKDNTRIQMKVWCPADEEMISRSDTVKGYEYAPDQYVIINDEDLDKVPLKTVRAIEIEQFAPRAKSVEEHARFTKQAYLVEPDKIGRKAFYLLRSVLAAKDLTAICKVVIRDREALAVIDPYEDTMLLTTLHWPDEIRSSKELDLPAEEQEFKPAELRMAEQLVEAMTEDFDPARYKDDYREALLKVIEAKIEGVEIAQPEPVEESAKIVDLMKLLEASVKAAADTRAQAATPPVSVAAAKQERAARAGKPKPTAASPKVVADASPKVVADASPKVVADAPEEAAASRPARRRKSA